MSKLLKDTVIIGNYIGEVDDLAAYQETILNRCYMNLTEGAIESNSGKRSSDHSRLYIFDKTTKALSIDGSIARTYLPHEQFEKLENKSAYWTISDEGMDYLLKGDCKLKINSFSHKANGSKRMWHFEVDAK